MRRALSCRGRVLEGDRLSRAGTTLPLRRIVLHRRVLYSARALIHRHSGWHFVWLCLVTAGCSGHSAQPSAATPAVAPSVSQIPPPSGWSSTALGPTQSAFVPPGAAGNPGLEYVGDIIVTVYSSDTDVSSFYRSAADFDTFTNSDRSEMLTINGAPAVRFIGVRGMVPSNILAFARNGAVVEIVDVGQKHTSDGLLNQIAAGVH